MLWVQQQIHLSATSKEIGIIGKSEAEPREFLSVFCVKIFDSTAEPINQSEVT